MRSTVKLRSIEALFAGRHFDCEAILWCLCYKLSLRNLVGIMPSAGSLWSTPRSCTSFSVRAVRKAGKPVQFSGQRGYYQVPETGPVCFKQIKMLDSRYFAIMDGSIVFVELKGDYIAQAGTAYKNVYIFKFAVRNGKISEVYEYANPVTCIKSADQPIRYSSGGPLRMLSVPAAEGILINRSSC